MCAQRRVLLRAWAVVPPLLHQQVQGDRGGGTEETVASRVPERVTTWRSAEKVSESAVEIAVNFTEHCFFFIVFTGSI